MEAYAPSIAVTTRGGWRNLQQAELAHTNPSLLELIAPAPAKAKPKALNIEPPSKKRPPTTSVVAPVVKKQRISSVKLSPAIDKQSRSPTPAHVALKQVKRHASASVRSSPSRTLSPEPVYRGNDRCRSASSSTAVNTPVTRDHWTDEDGRVGPSFVSSEMVVRGLKHGYKTCV